ncbi:MAG: HIT domain-containing protein [Spirochaetaceae bacterium]|jgi:histidine triad (HIT) family protein|nr:HIT domain-containing protein [Spirochaetaceae bacterium]
MGLAGMAARRLVNSLPRRKKYLILTAAVFAANLFLDRFTKYLAVRLLTGRGVIRLLGDSVLLYLTGNTGAFLSLGASWSPPVKYLVLLYLPLAVCAAALFHLIFFENRMGRIVIMASIAGGGVSNLLDRLFNNFEVIDFLNFGIGPLRTGVLNVADLSVTFGAIILCIGELAASRKKTAPAPALHDAAPRGTLAAMGTCIFCEIAAGRVPATKIFEDDEILAFHDTSPQAPVHVLVIPRAHRRNIFELDPAGDDGIAGRLLLRAAELARAQGCAEKGARFVINAGDDGGQTVDHLHIHVLGGRPLGWPPG